MRRKWIRVALVAVGVFVFALVTLTAVRLTARATTTPRRAVLEQKDHISVLADRPGAVIYLEWTTHVWGEIRLWRNETGDADRRTRIALVLSGDTRFREKASEGLKFINLDDLEDPRCQDLDPVTCFWGPIQVILFPALDAAYQYFDLRPVIGWTDYANGQRVMQTPQMHRGFGLAYAADDPPPWPPLTSATSTGWYRPDPRSKILTDVAAKRDEELVASFPTGRGVRVATESNAARWAMGNAILVAGGYARFIAPSAAERAQRDLLIAGILFGLLAAIGIEAIVLGLKTLW